MPEQSWVKNSQSFDTVPEDYDAFRPSYPDKLFETIISVSKISPQARILEIGSGTGKATLPLAQKGFRIHCIEPGGNLIRVARRKLSGYPQVTFEQVRFEGWNGSRGEFDLVISAQAFHWIEPVLGYEKVANSLKPGGHLALFWNKHAETQDPIEEELQAVYRDMALESVEPAKRIEHEIKERRAAIRLSGFFQKVTVKRFPWSEWYDCRGYLGLLGTYSDHIALSERKRKSLLEGIAEVIQKHGGWIERRYQAVLYLAQRQ